MDANGGRAGPASGPQVIDAVQAAMAVHPGARFEGNELGNLVVTCEGEYVGWIDVRGLGVMPDVPGREELHLRFTGCPSSGSDSR